MMELLKTLVSSIEAIGFIHTVLTLFMVGIVGYIIYVANRVYKSDKQTIERQDIELTKVHEAMRIAIHDNRDMSEKQLIAVNILSTKIDAYLEITQNILMRHIGDGGGADDS